VQPTSFDGIARLPHLGVAAAAFDHLCESRIRMFIDEVVTRGCLSCVSQTFDSRSPRRIARTKGRKSCGPVASFFM
jgi:hypothetical protein